jgi:hypothetical protein
MDRGLLLVDERRRGYLQMQPTGEDAANSTEKIPLFVNINISNKAGTDVAIKYTQLTCIF